MKAYAVHLNGCYWLAYAPTADRAKGLVLQRVERAYRPTIRTLRCRRWADLDSSDDRARLEPWGVPGTRDWETGTRIELPEPFWYSSRPSKVRSPPCQSANWRPANDQR